MSFSIRAADTGDAAAIAAIYAPFVLSSAATFELQPPDAAEIATRMANVQQRGLPYLVATRDDAVVGYAYATPFRPRPAYRFTVENSVYVRQDHAGRGIGGQLMHELIEGCRAAGCKQILAVIGGENPASIALHSRLGFIHAGELHDVGFKFDQFHNVTLMQLAL
jgi:phosphinothricin acetyltransferase